MSETTTDATGTTGAGTTDATQGKGVLDLRPPEDSVMRQLLRLGFKYDHKDEAEGTQTWFNWDIGAQADFPDRDASGVAIRDTNTNLSQTVDLATLRGVERIATWGSDGNN